MKNLVAYVSSEVCNADHPCNKAEPPDASDFSSDSPAAGPQLCIETTKVNAEMFHPQKNMTASQALAGFVSPLMTPQEASFWLEESKNVFSDAVREPWA